MNESIREELRLIAEQDYKKFTSSLLPGIDNVLGVRLPIIRDLAKRIVKGNWREELMVPDDFYFEEVMLRGMIIGYSNMDIEETLAYVTEFIPKINNWSICDSFCTSLKIVQKHREQVWDYLQKYLYSDKEFEVRVGLILLLDHFIKCDRLGKSIPRRRVVTMENILDNQEEPGKYTNSILEILNREFSQGYYAQMAAAWTLAETFCTFPYHSMEFLKNCNMDSFTYKKAIQKICESKTPTNEVKKYLKLSANNM